MNPNSFGLKALLLIAPFFTAEHLSAQTVAMSFSSLGTALITFDGSGSALSFSHDSSSGYDFQIGSSSLSGIVGYDGNISGKFTIGQISQIGFGLFQGQEADVSGSGILSISDGTASTLTAAIRWNSVWCATFRSRRLPEFTGRIQPEQPCVQRTESRAVTDGVGHLRHRVRQLPVFAPGNPGEPCLGRLGQFNHVLGLI